MHVANATNKQESALDVSLSKNFKQSYSCMDGLADDTDEDNYSMDAETHEGEYKTSLKMTAIHMMQYQY